MGRSWKISLAGFCRILFGRISMITEDRRDPPFQAFNCAAVPENLVESELFGYEPGAFSGASRRHHGLFKLADGGTLFLDEIGDLPPGVQVKLLRALQEGEIRPLGSERVVPVRIRIIAATHRDLTAMVADGSFREDLFYRLNGSVPLQLPPLRERRSDIPALVRHGLAGSGRTLSREAMAVAKQHQWPGNVRQLVQSVRMAAALSRGRRISAECLQRVIGDTAAAPVADIDAVVDAIVAGHKTAQSIRGITGLSERRIWSLLRELVSTGRLGRSGRGKNTRYECPRPARPRDDTERNRLNPRQKDCLNRIGVGAFVSTAAYCAMFRIGRATAFRDLVALADAGYLEATGRGRSAGYRRTKFETRAAT